MYWNQIYLDTFIPELPKHWNYNFASVQRSMDIYYDASQGILIKPLTTTGKVKASKGEFVTAIVDNLVVRNQYTNLYENITTADYSWYSAFIGPDSSTRDSSIWESSAYKYLDINKPYYKIDNLNPIALRCKQVSQIVELLFDPCTDSPNDFKIQLDPCTDVAYYLPASDASGTWISFICTKYDPSYGSTWTRYHFGSDVSANGGGGGGGYVLPIASSTVLGGIKVGPGLKITAGVLTVNDASFVTKSLFDSSISYLTTTTKIYVDGSLAARDTSISWLNTNKPSKAYIDGSLATRDILINWLNANMMTSPYVDGSLYARDVSIAWLAANTINFSSVKNYVDGSLSARDVSIAWLNANKISSFYVDNALISRDASIVLLNTNKASLIYVDGSLSARDTSIAWLAANTINFSSVKTYVDGSLSARDTSIAWLNTNKASLSYVTSYVDGSLSARDVSIAWLAANSLSFQTVKNYIDPSLSARDTSIAWLNTNKTSKIYVDGSLAARDVSIAWLDSNKVSKLYVDGSLSARDTSIAWLNTNKASLSYVTSYVDGSLSNFIRSSSTGATLKWNSGILDVSTSYYVPPVSDILDWSTNKYIPYAIKPAKLAFYTGTDVPDDNTRLNLNGYLYASMFVTLNNGTIGINSNQSDYATPAVKINNDSITEDPSYGVLYTNSLVGTAGAFVTGESISPETNNRISVGHNILLIRSPYPGSNISYAGNFINIIDDPSTSGDISGKVLSAKIGDSERVSFYPRVADSSSAIAYMLDTSSALSIYGAKLLSLKNSGIEKFYVDASGNAYANGILLGSGGGGTTYNFTNGLTLQDSSVKLGGNLNQLTDIDISDYSFKIRTTNSSDLDSGSFIYLDNATVQLHGEDPTDTNVYCDFSFGNGYGNLSFTTSLFISDANATPVGLQYGADYSATFVDRSLVDKGYVIAYAEPSLGNPSIGGYILSSTSDGVRSWIPSSGGVTPVSAILDWSTNKYIPYPTKTETGGNCYFYSSGAAGFPDYAGILFLNGVFIPNSITIDTTSTGIDSHSTVGNGGNFSSDEGYTLYCTQAGSVAPSSPNVHIDRLSSAGSSNITADLVEINDNPTTSGSISGSILKARTGTTVRIDMNPRVATTAGNAYILDTHNVLTTSRILSLKNQGTEKFYVDASGNAYANGILLGAGGGGVTPVAAILDWSTNKYVPYVSQTTGCFDNSSTDPSHTTRLNYDGYLHAGAFLVNESTVTGVGYIASYCNATSVAAIYGGNGGAEGFAIVGDGVNTSHGGWFKSDKGRSLYLTKVPSGSDTSAHLLEISRTGTGSINITGDIINITDNPTNSGIISGSILKATLGSTVRMNMNPRVSDTSTSIAYMLDTSSALSIYGAKLLSLKNSGTEKFYVDVSGNAYANGVLLGINGAASILPIPILYKDGDLDLNTAIVQLSAMDSSDYSYEWTYLGSFFSSDRVTNTNTSGTYTCTITHNISGKKASADIVVYNYTSRVFNSNVQINANTNYILDLTAGSGTLFNFGANGKQGIGIITPSAWLHLKAGESTAGRSPIKFTKGTNLTNPEVGALEWDGTNLFITNDSSIRKTIAFTGDSSGGVTPTDNILHWDSSNNYYIPYTSKQSGINFYTGTTDPDGTTRLNLNADLHISMLTCVNSSNWAGVYVDNEYATGVGLSVFNGNNGTGIDVTNSLNGNGIKATNDSGTGAAIYIDNNSTTGIGLLIDTDFNAGLFINNSGVHGAGTTGNMLVLSRTQSGSGSAEANFISITDNPTNSGTISGKILTAIMDTSIRIDFNPRVAATAGNAYILDTCNLLTTSRILSLRNQGAEKFYIDSSGNAYANGILLGAGGGGVTPTNNILEWDAGNSWYAPYATKTQGAFYTENVMPTHSNPLLYDGKIYATEFLSYITGAGIGFYAENSADGTGIYVSNSSTGIGLDLSNDWTGFGVSIYNGLTGTGLNISNQSTGKGISISNGSTGYGIDINQFNGTGIRIMNSVGGGGNSNGTYMDLSRTQSGSGNATGDFISITDSPTTSGTISGKILSVLVDTSIRIEFNPRVVDSSSAIAYKLESNNFLSTPGSKILSIKNNSSERFKITPTATNIVCGSSNTFSTVSGVLKDFYIDAGNVSTGETDLYTYTVPANVLSINGDKLIALYSGVYDSSHSTDSIVKAYFAGTEIGSIQPDAALIDNWIIKAVIIRVSSTVARVNTEFEYNAGGTGKRIVSYTELTSKDWTTTNILKITGTSSDSNYITSKIGTIEYKPAAVN
ncbi:MAG: hypothetical protein PHF86_02165 [Candidatus Nanoarchaeia archaeon]|nr:hypothetical protein [Candidatus Nanoarchaeia archaeon]